MIVKKDIGHLNKQQYQSVLCEQPMNALPGIGSFGMPVHRAADPLLKTRLSGISHQDVDCTHHI